MEGNKNQSMCGLKGRTGPHCAALIFDASAAKAPDYQLRDKQGLGDCCHGAQGCHPIRSRAD